jgi:hypothetical protein
MIRYIFAFLLVVLLSGAHAQEQASEFRPQVNLQESSVRVGDKLVVTFTAPDQVNGMRPEIKAGQFLENWLVMKVTEDKESGRWHVTFVPTLPDSGAIPEIKWKSDSQAGRTPPIPVKVDSVLKEKNKAQAEQQLHPLKNPYQIPIPWWWYALIVLGLLILATLIWMAIKRYISRDTRDQNTQAPEEPVDTRTPFEKASERLDTLQKQEYPKQGKLEIHYFELTETLKEYTERRFQIQTLESTTSEISALLPGRVSDKTLCDRYLSFLQEGDLAKFARLNPESSEVDSSIDRTRAMIRTLEEIRKKEEMQILQQEGTEEN